MRTWIPVFFIYMLIGLITYAAFYSNTTFTTGQQVTATILNNEFSNIANGVAQTANIANGAVTTAKIADSQVTSAKIANGTITNSDIDTGTITGTNILDNTVDTADLATDSVTTTEILNGTITNADIDTGTITGTNIQDNTVDTIDLASESVTTTEIADGTITSTDIAPAGITAVSIENQYADQTSAGATAVSGVTTIATTSSVSPSQGIILVNSNVVCGTSVSAGQMDIILRRDPSTTLYTASVDCNTDADKHAVSFVYYEGSASGVTYSILAACSTGNCGTGDTASGYIAIFELL